MSLTKSLIQQQHRPILDQLLVRLSLRQGQAFSLEQAAMPYAIERIVDTYVQLDKRQALEDLLLHRQRLAVNFKARTGYDFNLPLRQVEDEIAIIEAGLKRLARAARVA